MRIIQHTLAASGPVILWIGGMVVELRGQDDPTIAAQREIELRLAERVQPPGLGMSPPVACIRVDGLEQFTPLPDATLTSADKLKVYFRPLRYKVEVDLKNKSPYRAKFTEDGKIRRKGEKTPIAKEEKLLEYETRYAEPAMQIYLVNTIGLEKLTPGEYELDITLHDMIDGQATARQTLPFRIVPSAPNAEPPMLPASKTTKPAQSRRPKAGRESKRTTSPASGG